MRRRNKYIKLAADLVEALKTAEKPDADIYLRLDSIERASSLLLRLTDQVVDLKVKIKTERAKKLQGE